MKNYQLYKVRVEKEFVVAAPIEMNELDVEGSVLDIMRIHESSMRDEAPTFVIAEEIRDLGDLPLGWEEGCLPYSKYTHINMPEELVNKTIKEHLQDGTDKINS